MPTTANPAISVAAGGGRLTFLQQFVTSRRTMAALWQGAADGRGRENSRHAKGKVPHGQGQSCITLGEKYIQKFCL
ncbi:MAG TPA: hypothetical protein IAA99_03250 [Candidatus Avibacteroides faecavium]|nr:hypothetical protein [Candidatus Avibacteroides faecavium]